MSFMKKIYRRGVWILGLGLAISQAAHAGDLKSVNCPANAARADIEVLPAPPASFTLQGSLINYSPNPTDSRTYEGSACLLQSFAYKGGYTVYKVYLHEGNQVAFRLEPTSPPTPPADLVLALVMPCDPAQCIASSPDFIGPGVEEIAARHYQPGYYYLFVDSASDQSGSYTLKVTGVNPTPDLVLTVTDSPEPVIAGDSLTYTLNVTNSGALNATGVKITLDLPSDVTLSSADPGCNLTGSTLTCAIGGLAINESQTRRAVVDVSPAARGELTVSAKATATEGNPTPEQTVRTMVRTESDLWIEMAPSINPVVAGTPLIYTLRIHNDGPSNATNVMVTDPMPGAVDFATSPGCSLSGGTVACKISGIAVGAVVVRSLNVNVKSSAAGTFANTAQVTANEDDPGPKPNSATVTSNVIHRTDLSIVKTGPNVVIAGMDFPYTVTVRNGGPSDSTERMVDDPLPSKLTFVSAAPGSDCTRPNGGIEVVNCMVGQVPAGGTVSATFMVHPDPSLRTPDLKNTACTTGNEQDQHLPVRICSTSSASVEARASLRLVETAERISDLTPTDSVLAGENLVYTLSVTNDGPSDWAGGMIKDTLTGGLIFVSSPDNCQGPGNVVSCTVPPIPAGKSSPAFRFVAVVPSGFAGTTLNNQLSFVEQEDATFQTTSVTVSRNADLAVTLSASPSPVTAGSPLTYTLTVTNLGPSDATGVTATLLNLPGQLSLPLDSRCTGSSEALQCHLDDLTAGSSRVQIPIQIKLPDNLDPAQTTIMAEASVGSSTPDAVPDNNSATTTTTLAQSSDADLAITKSTAVEGVVVGNLLNYTLAVTNNGPAVAQGVKVDDTLPPGLSFVSAGPGCSTSDNDKLKVTCDLGYMAPDTVQQRNLTVRVYSDFTGTNIASVQSSSQDPDPGNDTSTVTTPVLQLPSLVLPFFEVASDLNGPTTLLAVRNPTDATVGIRINYFATDGTQVREPDFQSLSSKQIFTTNLRDLTLLQNTGYVGITPLDQGNRKLADPPPALSGDFIRVDSPALAGALPLVSTDTARLPPELCRRWSTRFINDGSIASSTDFLFFVPGNTGGPVAVGKVYTEDGTFVQEITVSAQEQAFRRTTRDDPDHQIPLLAKFGSIEWELPQGVGNIAAVYRAGDQYEVAVPGTCRGSESTLVVPYFEVDPQNPPGTTTLFAVRNESGDQVSAHYECFSSDVKNLNSPCPGVTFPLKAHATQTVNLRDVVQAPATGYVKVTANGPISGDFVRVDHAAGRAVGGALVDTDPQRVPPQLCSHWSVRFLEDANARVSTAFVFFIDNTAGGTTLPMAKYSVYPEDSNQDCSAVPSVPVPESLSFTQPASGLGLGGSCKAGSIEWDLGGLQGNVAAVFKTADGLSVLVPGVCADATAGQRR